MPTSNATAVWEGGLKNGKGRYSAGSDAFSGEYSFPSRFEGTGGSTPEELIAAAHAACFSMALSAGLERAGKTPKQIETRAACTLEMLDDGPKITTMQLSVAGSVDGVDQADFEKAAGEAVQNCPVSGALKGNVEFKLEATLR